MGVSIVTGVLSGIGNIKGVMNWAMERGGVIRTSNSWLTGALAKGAEMQGLDRRASVAFFGTPAKFPCTLGIVGCVFSIVSSFWGINAEGDLNGPNV